MKAIVFVVFLMVLVDYGKFCFDAPYLCVSLGVVLIIVPLMRVVALQSDDTDTAADPAATRQVQADGGWLVNASSGTSD